MPVNTYHLRSSIKGKEPAAGNNAGQLPVGSIAINFNADEPFLTIQDSAGNVRRIAGVKIDTTAPTTPTAGEWWVDTSGATKIVKVFDGTSWVATGSPVVDATDSAKGIVELATAAETTTGTDATRAVTPAGLKVELDKKAPLASPALTGTPTAPTAAAGTNTTQLATTAFVTAAVAVENLWDRTGTVVSPANAGDQVHAGTGKLTVGGTAAAPAVSLDPGTTGKPFVRDSSGRIGIGVASPSADLHILNATDNGAGGLTSVLRLGRRNGGPNDAILNVSHDGSDGVAAVCWNLAGAERQRITNTGVFTLGNGTNNAVTLDPGSTGSPLVRDSTGKIGVGLAAPLHAVTVQGGGEGIVLSRSLPAPNDGQLLGYYGFAGDNQVVSASILGRRDGGTWTSGTSHPSSLVFQTTPDGSATPVERMRIKSDGSIACTPGSGGVTLAVGATSWAATSDERQKTNLEPIADGLEKVSTLRAVTGRYKTDAEDVSRSFLIAQDVQAVLPEAVSQDGDDGILSLRYSEVIPLLVAALKESKERIEQLEQRLTDAGIA